MDSPTYDGALAPPDLRGAPKTISREESGIDEGQSGDCPPNDSTYIESEGQGDKGQKVPIPKKWISYRITTPSRDVVFDIFKKIPCVIGDEVSAKGVRHFHVVVAGHEDYDRIKKRIQRLKLGRAMVFSEKNRGTFLGAVAYTIKDGEVYARGFNEYIKLAEEKPFVSHVSAKDVKANVSDWMLSFNNVLPVAMRWRESRGLTTDDLGSVLRDMMRNSKWIPSPQMLKNGLDHWHYNMFRFRCGSVLEPPDWWTPRVDSDFRFHSMA